MAKIIGIDLGTTNSVVAVVQGADPVVIPAAEGGPGWPGCQAPGDPVEGDFREV